MKCKIYTLLLAIFAGSLAIIPAHAQDNPATMHKGLDLAYSAHFGAIDGFLLVNHELSVSMVLNKRVELGLFGEAAVPPVGPTFAGWEDSNASLILGGFHFAYLLNPGQLPKLSLTSRAGWGLLMMQEGNLEVSSFALGIRTGFDLSSRFRLDLGLGYHVENPMDLYVNKDGFISGPEVSAGLTWQLIR